jgi:hypothetical protein
MGHHTRLQLAPAERRPIVLSFKQFFTSRKPKRWPDRISLSFKQLARCLHGGAIVLASLAGRAIVGISFEAFGIAVAREPPIEEQS